MAKVVLNKAALRRLLTSPQAEAMVRQRADRIAAACNSESSWGGYRSDSERTGSRARARVYNISDRGQADEARNNRLIRGLNRGGE